MSSIMSYQTHSNKASQNNDYNRMKEIDWLSKWNNEYKLSSDEIDQISKLSNIVTNDEIMLSGDDDSSEKSSQNKLDDLLQYIDWRNKSDIDDEIKKFELLLNNLLNAKSVYSSLNESVNGALNTFINIEKKYEIIHKKFFDVYSICENYASEIQELEKQEKNLERRIEIFESLESISNKLNSPSLNVEDEYFQDIIKKIEDCTALITKEPLFITDPDTFLMKFNQLLNKALIRVRDHIISVLKQITIESQNQIKKSSEINSEDPHSLISINIPFKLSSTRLKSLCSLLEIRASKNQFVSLLSDVQNTYFKCRNNLISDVISKKLFSISKNNPDIFTLIRQSSHYFISVSEAELQLYESLFSQPSNGLSQLIESLATPLYDIIRPIIVRCSDLDTLCSIVNVFTKEIIEKFVDSKKSDLSPLVQVILKIVEDVQSRLIFLSDSYIMDEIASYEPRSEELNYPDILMKSSSESSESVEQGTLYSTLEKTILLLSKLYLTLNEESFNGIANLALTMCIHSLCVASKKIEDKDPLDGELFLIRQLIALENLIRPYDIDFFSQNKMLDFSHSQGLIRKLMKGELSITSVFALSSNNALFTILQSAISPRLKYSKVNLKKNMNNLLSKTIESFIFKVTQKTLESMFHFVTISNSIVNKGILGSDGKNITKTLLCEQEFASVANVSKIIEECRNNLRTFIPSIIEKMKVYVKEESNLQMLITPIRKNIIEAISNFNSLIKREYRSEDVESLNLLNIEDIEQLVNNPQ